MPSPIAHSVSGYIIAKFLPLNQLIPSGYKRWGIHIFYPVLVAAAADFDFIPQLITGENYHRGLTHSLIFAIAFSAIIGLIFRYLWKCSYKIIFGLTLIFYGSHLLLDLFSEGRGIQLFWPFTDSYFQSPLIIFPGFHYSRGLWDSSHLIPLVFELTYSALLFWLVARWKTFQVRKKNNS